MTLNDTRVIRPRRRGLDPRVDPAERTAAAARVREAAGRGQIQRILAEPAPAAVDVPTILGSLRAALGPGATITHYHPGDGSGIATPNELDDVDGQAAP